MKIHKIIPSVYKNKCNKQPNVHSLPAKLLPSYFIHKSAVIVIHKENNWIISKKPLYKAPILEKNLTLKEFTSSKDCKGRRE